MIKLKDLLSEGQAMTPQEKKRTISKLNRFDRPQLVNMLRVAADAANRSNARADDLAHIYRDELNSRDNIGEVTDGDEEQLDEAPSGAVIAGALDAIRSEVRHKDPEIQKWLYPHLRKIENALRKFKRSGS